MKTQFLRRGAAVLFTVGLLAVSMVGCSDSGTTPRDTYSDGPRLLSRPLPKLTGSNLDAVALNEDQALEDSTQISETVGGDLSVGDEQVGHSGVSFPEDAFESDGPTQSEYKIVKARVTRFGEVTAELHPEGVHFKKPVWLTLSYKGADLTGIDESKLVIMYLNESMEPPVWEVIDGSVVDTQKKTVGAPLSHFSRYGIGSDE